MKYERFLVTGGAGFIGSHLVDGLLADGGQVVVIDDFNDYYDPQLKHENVAPHRAASNYMLVQGDIRDMQKITEIVARHRPQVIVHLAARAGVRPSLTDPFLYESTNVLGTLNLLEAARHHGIERFVFGSSSSVYGLNTKVPFSEHDPLFKQVSPYAATKLAGESLCNVYAHLYALPIVSLRFFTVYGPRQRPDLAIRKFAEKMLRNEPIELFGDGSTSRDYTFVADIIAGIRASIDLQSEGHEVFNLGNSSPISLLELVRLIEQAFGVTATIEWSPDQPGDVPRTFADIERSRTYLGYQPNTTFEVGLERFARWLVPRFPSAR